MKHEGASVTIAAVTPLAHAVLAFGPVSNWSTPPGDLIYEIGSVIGLGWMILEFGSGTLVWHNGGTGGFNSFVGFVKEKGAGVCVLMNRGPSFLSAFGLGPPLAESIGFRILKSLANGAA